VHRRPLIALAVVTASVLTLATPAGATSSKMKPKTNPDWVRIVLPCRVGHKSAVVGYSPTHPWWLEDPAGGDGGIPNPHGWRAWYNNPCPGQWLLFDTWGGDPSPDSMNYWSVGTGPYGKAAGFTSPWATLSDTPHCPDGGADYTILAKAKQQRAACQDT
jgi:hypothetical protein